MDFGFRHMIWTAISILFLWVPLSSLQVNEVNCLLFLLKKNSGGKFSQERTLEIKCKLPHDVAVCGFACIFKPAFPHAYYQIGLNLPFFVVFNTLFYLV